MVGIGRVDEILPQDVGRPRLGALHVQQALVGRERGLCPPLVEPPLPDEIDGDHGADRHDEDRHDGGDAALRSARRHPLVSTSRDTRP
jgi:hypothetical protein